MADKYKFDYKDDYFDFIFLTSVFTHLKPTELNHYLSEIHRVLKPKGQCLFTCFILNDESIQCIKNKKSAIDFIYDYDGCKVKDINDPEAAIAYKENNITKMITNNNFNIKEDKIHYGQWSGRENYFNYQDIIIINKA